MYELHKINVFYIGNTIFYLKNLIFQTSNFYKTIIFKIKSWLFELDFSTVFFPEGANRSNI